MNIDALVRPSPQFFRGFSGEGLDTQCYEFALLLHQMEHSHRHEDMQYSTQPYYYWPYFGPEPRVLPVPVLGLRDKLVVHSKSAQSERKKRIYKCMHCYRTEALGTGLVPRKARELEQQRQRRNKKKKVIESKIYDFDSLRSHLLNSYVQLLMIISIRTNMCEDIMCHTSRTKISGVPRQTHSSLCMALNQGSFLEDNWKASFRSLITEIEDQRRKAWQRKHVCTNDTYNIIKQGLRTFTRTFIKSVCKSTWSTKRAVFIRNLWKSSGMTDSRRCRQDNCVVVYLYIETVTAKDKITEKLFAYANDEVLRSSGQKFRTAYYI